MLQKQSVHLNLTGGLQKKDDEFIVIPSKLAVADNVQFDDASTVIRRGGQSSLSLGAFNALAIKRAFTHQGVAVLDQGSQMTRAGAGGVSQVLNPSTVNGFTPSRAARRAGMVTQRIAGVTTRGTGYGTGIPWYDGSYDCASIGNVTCYVFETRSIPLGTQTVRVVLIDDANNNFRLYDSTLADGTKVLVKPRVVATASKFYIFFGSFVSGAGTFDIKSLTLSSSGSASAVNAVVSAVAGHGGLVEGTADDAIIFDVATTADLSKIGLVLRFTDILTAHYDVDPTDGYTVLSSGSTIPSAFITSLTALYTKNASDEYSLHAFYSIGTNVAKAAYRDITNATSSLEATVGTAAGGTVVGRIAAYENSSSLIYVAFDAQTSAEQSRLRLSSCTHTHASLSECASLSPWFVAGRIASVDSRLYLPMVFMSAEYQGTYFVIDLTSALGNLGVAGAAGEPPHVVARIDYGESALITERRVYSTRVPNMPVRSNSLLLPYLKFETDLRLVGTANDTTYALSRATIDFSSHVQHEEINGITFLAGACPLIYDGSVLVEEGFHHGPEVLSVGAAAAAGTYQFPNASDTYTFCFTQAWQDAQGNWWESAPSEEQTITIVAASGNYFITPTIVQAPTQKPGARLLMYRTKGDSTDTTLYLATDYAGSSDISDANLDDGEQLYTSGNVLPNTPAPACRHVSTFQKRLVLSGCGDGSKVHWSKVTTPGYGVEFSSGDPTHQTVVPASLGRAVGTEEMDDRLFILCENGHAISGGNGPNSSGTAGQYSDPATIVTEVGASWDSPKSIIRGPEGIWFRSPFGMRLISRSGGLGMVGEKQAGSEVDSLVSGNVIAVAGDAKQQIRFFQTSGTCLVWDYQWKQWTRFTGMACVDAVYADDRYYHVSNTDSGTLMRYTDETTYTDVNDAGTAGVSFNGIIETPWLSFAGVQGFQRIYRLKVLGKNSNATGQLVVSAVFNYDFDANTTGDSISAASITSSASMFQLEHHFSKQKCESLKMRITFYPKAGESGRLRITDLTLQVGVKSGYNKLPSSKRY